MIASHRKSPNQGVVVGTLMTNLAIENGFKALKIPFVRSAVGDRYVHEKLIENQWVLGGEGSGHIICLDKHTTGDGIVSSLQVLAVLRESGVSLGQCLSSVELCPQILHNLPLKDNLDQEQIAQVKTLGDAAENRLGPEYRVLIRESGTEPLLRIMVEGRRVEIVQNAVQDLTESIWALILET